MELGAKARAALLLWRLLEGSEAPAVRPICAQKKPFPFESDAGSRLPRSTPEAEGVDPEMLYAFIDAASSDKREDIHSMTVLRHGKVIAEHSCMPYDREIWHVTHSLCKTVTALAVGILIGDGKLRVEDRVCDLFPKVHTASWYKNLTVFHLLTMASGASFNEVRSVTEHDWVRGFLSSPPFFPVGERFHYNSMNSYMLAAVICTVTGETLSGFLEKRLFSEMGIRRFRWEVCPRGIEKGGWGLYLLQEDAAKLGQLILNRGKWNGKQLVPEGYIRDMCLWHSDPPEKLSRSGYGYQCWLWERENSVRMSGLFGQTVLVVPDKDMVLAVNAGSNRIFGEAGYLCGFSKLLNDGVFDHSLIISRPPSVQKPSAERKSVPCPRGGASVVHSYTVQKRGIRLLPVFLQLSGNNYTGGIDRISFLRIGSALFIDIYEGTERNRLEVGFRAPVMNRVTANRETFLVACSGKWGRKGSSPCLSVRVCFLEEACTRYLEFEFLTENTVHIRLYETPGRQVLTEGASVLFDDPLMVRRLSGGRVADRIKSLCEPECTGWRTKKAAPEFRMPQRDYGLKGEAGRARPR